MIKAIVLYNSRTGNTKKVAMKIAEGLEVESKNHRNIPNLQDYDLIVVGSWVIMGMLSFAGKRYLKKLHRKNITGKKVALFFTAGSPDEINPMIKENEIPKPIKEVMFAQMEKVLNKNRDVTILPERFYCQGAFRLTKKGKERSFSGHPNDEDLAQARGFGEQLKKYL